MLFMLSWKVVDFGQPRGHGLVTTQPLKSDQVIFEESPLVSCQFSWNRLYGYLACDHCMCPLESATTNAQRLTGDANFQLAHLECDPFAVTNPTICQACGVTYCSLACMQAASNLYHSVVCPSSRSPPADHPLHRLDELWRQLHYPPETSTIWLLVRIVGVCLTSFVRHSSDAQRIVDILKTFVSSTTETSSSISGDGCGSFNHKLLQPEFSSSLLQLHNAFSDVLIHLVKQLSSDVELMSMLQQAGIVDLVKLDHFRTALCMIGRNGQGIATSSFSVWVRSVEQLMVSADSNEKANFDEFLSQVYEAMDNHVGTFLDNEGVGLYEYQRLLNHSCDPNAVVRFNGMNHSLSVVSLRPLQIGEEITISYLDACQQNRSRHWRRKQLSVNYLFWCACPKCESEKPVDGTLSETSDEEVDESYDDSVDGDVELMDAAV